ncbi:Salmochelin siderophore protein IroE [Superficieibacter electus]|uniref:Salmochelin siderophore protein IroE n=1 Tax=Superficieibacter electus TaxID=2022662 RepID=A0A2P5GNT8_9ENTR|nr:alpha/beta hydrolase-fold protein [Superficieibacter electus]POP44037.1 Salmochelin siderophore protein IroE [Superficieibacter electus]POP48209.1 Salmochelin siderophore protein IroE [Superficieibacter electus]
MDSRTRQHDRLRRALLSTFSCIVLLYGAKGYARPDMKPLGPNIADKGSAFYHFRVEQFDSADGKRHYKVWTAIPNKKPAPSGYPVLYMLDGNAVMGRLSEMLLQQLAEKTPPVIIAIGYQTDLPFDANSRAWDYTPVREAKDEKAAENGRNRREMGGSTGFRQLLEQQIAAKAEQGININPDRRGLWGHSYGGLFVLDSWLSSSFFRSYYSASPSLGQGYLPLLNRLTAVDKTRYCDKHLFLMEGTASPGKNVQTQAPDILPRIHDVVSVLQGDGIAVEYWDYPGLTHGPMFDASFNSALRDMSIREADRSACQK